MTKKYQVVIDDYSLNELANKLRLAIYGDKVVVSASDVVPAFSNLVESDPDTKGVTWELDYKGQADSLVNWINRVLDGRDTEPRKELTTMFTRGSWYYVNAVDHSGKPISFKAQGVEKITKLLKSFNVHHTPGNPCVFSVGLDSIIADITSK